MPTWVFARKGKRETPEIKARFVGQKFAEEDGRDGEVFAGTPELTAVRRLLTTHRTTWHGSATRVCQASRLETRQTNLLVVGCQRHAEDRGGLLGRDHDTIGLGSDSTTKDGGPHPGVHTP